MKRWFCALLIVLFCPALFAGGIYENRKIDLQKGNVCPARFGKVIFSDQFDKKGVWAPKPANYQNLLKINTAATYEGKSCLLVSGEGVPKRDTAWSVRSNPITLTDKTSEFALAFSLRSTIPINGSSTDGGTWQSRLEWFDASGKECASLPFIWSAVPGDFTDLVIYGPVPEEATSVVLQLGFDRPNIDMDNILVVRKVELSMIDPSNSWRETGWFVSEIFPGGNISWEADIPKGTTVKFQVSTADNIEKNQNAWTTFHGPDGTDKTFYTKPFKVDASYLRYKVFLTPVENACPTLKSVTVGDRIDSNWTRRRDMFPPRVKIVSETPTTRSRCDLVLEITDDASVFWNTFKATVDGKDIGDKFVRTGNRLTFKPTADWTPGLHKVDVEISDCYGNVNKAKKCFYLGKAPTTPKITMRDDGATLIDGKPFFPIGIYGVMKREFNDFDLDKAFKGLQEAGFNFAHSYSCPRSDEFLAAADKYGFKLWTVARFPDERFIEIERHHPAIIAWYLGDDTSANTTVAELYDRDDAVKALDPTRLTTQADGVAARNEISNYQDYVPGTDTFLPEIYPVYTTKPESGENCVAQTIVDMERCRADIAFHKAAPRSLWPIIQYFKGWGWERFPTMQELRGMSYAAIIHGGNGITWYTYGGTVEPEKKKFNYGITTTPEIWNNMSAVATQLKELTPVLLERTPANQPSPIVLDGPKTDPLGNASVSCLLKKYNGLTWLLCVNSSPKPVKAEIRLSGLSQGEVLYENRNITLKNGVLIDSFAGHDVHVYKLKP